MRALHPLAPTWKPEAPAAAGNTGLRRTAFTLGLFAVILELAIPANLLDYLGIHYDSPGGSLLIKLHPATYVVAIAACLVLMLPRPPGAGLVRLFRQTPALGLFLALILGCAFYSIANVGFSGAAIYVESFLSAGLLAVALRDGTDRQKRALAWWYIGFVVLSIVISLWEGATRTHLIPVYVGDKLIANMNMDAGDFRGAGLFGHPLNGALATAMATFLLLRMRMNPLVKAALFTTMMIGLLSFGGRAALGITILFLVGASSVMLMRGIVSRSVDPGLLAALAATALVLVPLLAILTATTALGDRILSHLYFDSSAEVRSIQWQVLNHLNLSDFLFGTSPARLNMLKYQIGLGTDTTDIENFWLLMFLNLGTMGFLVFLVAFGLFLVHLARATRHPLGWMLMIAAILIDSASNSLGRKSNDLFLMTACMVAMTGYQGLGLAATLRRYTGLRPWPGDRGLVPPQSTTEPSPSRQWTAQPRARRGRAAHGLAIRPSPANLAGLKP